MKTKQTLPNIGTTGNMVTTTAGKTNTRPSPRADFLRIVLGVILIWKGINFIRDTAVLEFLANQSGESMFTKNDAVMILAAGLLTLIFGVFIMVGLFARIAAFLQLLIFSLGMLFIHGRYIERNGFELLLTIAVPFLLLLFITKDDHALSANTYSGNKGGRSKHFRKAG